MSSEELEGNDTLELLIARYLESEKSGQSLDRAALIEEYQELADSLREFFANHDRMKGAVDPTLPSGDGEVKHAKSTVGDKVRYFGDYELLAEIARGGMGVVYKARQVNLNRIVALKMILAGQFAGEEDVQRFYTEAEAAASLDHPGIVPIFEIGEHQGQHYFSMGYIEGDSLAHKVADGPLPPREAAELVRKICDAMAYAHERGVIHRDLKPANILIDASGQPKVTDFGLAKKTEADSGLTGTGQILGTPAYMPPEQASGKTDEVGPLADVYSLGAILYCLLTGRPPFQAASPMDTLLQVLDQDPVSPRTVNSQVPQDLETICLKCLSKEPRKRYESSREFEAELTRFLKGEPIHARPVGNIERSWSWCRRNPVVASLSGAFVSALCIGLIASMFFAIRASLARNELERNLARTNYFLALARWDSNRIGDAITLLDAVPENHRGFEWHLAREWFHGGLMTLYGHTTPPTDVEFSPDGSQIVSVDRDKVWVWDAQRGEKVLTLNVDIDTVTRVAFSSDGSKIIGRTRDATLKVWDARNGDEIPDPVGLTDSEKTLHGLGEVSYYAISPDGSRIVTRTEENGKYSTIISDARMTKSLTLFEGGAYCAEFSPDGKQVVIVHDKQMQLWNANTGNQVLTFHADANSTPGPVAFSNDGSKIVSGSLDGTVRIWDVGTGQELSLHKGHRGPISCVSFAPNDSRIVSGSFDGTIRIWLAESSSASFTYPFPTDVLFANVSFSDKGRLTATGVRSGRMERWEVDSGVVLNSIDLRRTDLRRALKIVHHMSTYSFSNDGTRLAIGTGDAILLLDGNRGDVLATLSGHTSFVVSVNFDAEASMLVSGSSDGTVKLWSVDSGEEVASFQRGTEGYSVAINRGGTHLVSGGGGGTVWVWDLKTRQTIAECDPTLQEVGFASVALSPDGSRLATAAVNDDGTIKLWDSWTSEELVSFNSGSRVLSITFSDDGNQLASVHHDETIKLWSANWIPKFRVYGGHKSTVRSVSFNNDESVILARSRQGQIIGWDLSTGAMVDNDETWVSSEWRENQGTVSKDGRWLLLPVDKNVHVVDLDLKRRNRVQVRPEAY